MNHISVAFLVLALASCETSDASVTQLASILADEGGSRVLPEEYRQGYVSCGEEALANIPSDKVEAAIAAKDASTRWEILGDAALDHYVDVCRELDMKRGPPPVK